MANFTNFGIGVEAKIKADDIQKQLDKISVTKMPTMKIGIVIDQASIAKATQAIQKAMPKSSPNGLVTSTTGNAFGLSESNYKKYVANYDTGMSQMSKSTREFSKLWNESFTAKGDDYKAYTKNTVLSAKEVDNLTNSVTKSSGAFGKFGSTLMSNVGKFAQWLIAGNLIMQTLRQFQAAVQYVKDMDKAMTNLQIITGMSETSARGLISSYNQLGKEIGATTKEIADGAEEWFRAGKTAEEALYLTRQSLTLSKLAGMSAADSTQALISSLNGYKLAASEASSVIDKLIAVDNAAATSAQELANAMQLTAATAKIAGVDMNKLIGLIGTVSSVTRISAESIGSAFKTIFSRMGNVKVGKFIDDDTGESINDVEGVLNKLGIELRDSEDTFRDFGYVLDEIGGRWKSFTELEQSALATSIAGVRQKNIFISTMENYDQVLRLTTEAQDSSGLSAQRMELYTESLAGKTAKLQASMEGLYSTMLDSSVIKGLLDLVNVIVSITSALGGWTVIIPAVITLLAIFKSEWAVTNIALGLGSSIISGLTVIFPGFTAALEAVTVATGLSATAFSVLATGGLILLLTALPILYNYLRDNNEEFRRFFETTSDVAKNVVELTDKLSALNLEWQKLIDQSTLTKSEKERLDYLAAEIQATQTLLALEKQREYKSKYGGGTLASVAANLTGGVGEGEFTHQGAGTFDVSVIKSDLSDIGSSAAVLKEDLEVYQELKDMAPYVTLTAEKVLFLANMEKYLAEQSAIVSKKTEAQKGEMEKLSATFSRFDASVSGVSALYKEMADNGFISAKSVDVLRLAGSDLIDLLYVENGVYKLNGKAAIAYFNTKRAIAISSLKDQRKIVAAQIEEAKAAIVATQALITMAAALGGGVQGMGEVMNNLASAQNSLRGLNGALTQIDNSIYTLSHTTLPTYAGANNTVNDAIQKQIDLLEKQKKAATDAIDKQIDALQRQLDLLKNQNEETQNQIDLQKALDDLARARNQRNTRVYTSTGWEWQSDAGAIDAAQKNVSSAQQAIAEKKLQDQIDALTRKKEDVSASYDVKIDKLKGYSDGGVVNFTGPLMGHGTDANPEVMLNATETKVVGRLLSKSFGVNGVVTGAKSQSGLQYNIYGDINVKAENQETFTALLNSTLQLVKTGR